jgi:hypothetical protein
VRSLRAICLLRTFSTALPQALWGGILTSILSLMAGEPE